MFENLNKKTREILKKHKDNVTSIINDKISSINQKLDIINNLTAINKVKSKTNDLTLSWENSQNIQEAENKKLKEELTNLRDDLNKKDGYLKDKLRILEDRSRRNNIRVEGVPVSENERWDVTEEKLRKVIKDKLDNQNVVTEQTQIILKRNRIPCIKQNHVKLEILFSKNIFQEKLQQ